MRPDPQFPADLVSFTEEILNGKLHFLCSANRLNNLSRNLFPIHAVYAYMLQNTGILEIIEIKGSMDKKLVNSFTILFPAAGAMLIRC